MKFTYFDQHLPKRVILALVFAIAFSLIPRAIADFYFRYVDSTQYLVLTQPDTDRDYYKPCDTTILSTTITALLDLDVRVVNQLVLVRSDGSEYRIPDALVQVHTPFPKSHPHMVSGPYPLPCKLDDGIYFWRGMVSFSVRGVEKTAPFSSETFHVTQTGLSQDAVNYIQEATESAKKK